MAKKNQLPIEPEKEPEASFYEEDDESYQAEEFMEIGGSPAPGITLRQVLSGHTDIIYRIAWSPDGHYLASPSKDKTIRIWDVTLEQCVSILEEDEKIGFDIRWSPGRSLLAYTVGKTMKVWDAEKANYRFILQEEIERIWELGWSPGAQYLAYTSGTDNVLVRDVDKGDIRFSKSHHRFVRWLTSNRILIYKIDDRKTSH